MNHSTMGEITIYATVDHRNSNITQIIFNILYARLINPTKLIYTKPTNNRKEIQNCTEYDMQLDVHYLAQCDDLLTIHSPSEQFTVFII